MLRIFALCVLLIETGALIPAVFKTTDDTKWSFNVDTEPGDQFQVLEGGAVKYAIDLQGDQIRVYDPKKPDQVKVTEASPRICHLGTIRDDVNKKGREVALLRDWKIVEIDPLATPKTLRVFKTTDHTAYHFDVLQKPKYQFQVENLRKVICTIEMEEGDEIRVRLGPSAGVKKGNWKCSKPGRGWATCPWSVTCRGGMCHRRTVLNDCNAEGTSQSGVVELVRERKEPDIEPDIGSGDTCPKKPATAAHESYIDMMRDWEFDERESAQRGHGGYGGYHGANNGGIGADTIVIFGGLGMMSLFCCAFMGIVGAVIGYATRNYMEESQARRKDGTYDALERSHA